MFPHTRAMVAAAAYSFVTGHKIAGVHDHAAGQDLLIAAESRGSDLQGYDGDRLASFGGALPELYDGGDKTFVSLEIDGAAARGFDRRSMSHYALTVAPPVVQLYDYSEASWFSFTIQIA